MFQKAEQVFIKNRREEINYQAGFQCRFTGSEKRQYELHITGATLYRVYLNGNFLFYGPARAPHGYLRADNVRLKVKAGENVLCVEVAGYNCPSFGTMNHFSFLQAEIFENGKSICHTGRDFKAISLNGLREQKVYRYSYQRAFSEVWYLDNESILTNWKETDFEGEAICVHTYEEEIIPRGYANPDFWVEDFGDPVMQGRFEWAGELAVYRSRHFVPNEVSIVCYPLSEIKHDVLTRIRGKYLPDGDSDMTKNRYRLYDYGQVNTGFIKANLTAEEDSEVYIAFSEKPAGRTGFEMEDLISVIKYELKKSKRPYDLEAFEAYSMRYVIVLVIKGKIKVNRMELREYSYPLSHNTILIVQDEKLMRIFEAARETFRQNTLDCFMDCPGRERGGWLCDSYFTSQAEQIFAGKGQIEEQFLKNFTMAKEFPGIPEGLLPDNYPGELLQVIPQWIMWYILELEEYLKRHADNKEIFRGLCYQFLEYLQDYKCENRLLKKLEGWNFIEWSEANQYVEKADISYPTNMLYARVLESIGRLYGDEGLCREAEELKEQIIRCAFDGKLFCDGAVWNGTAYVNMQEISEACQYYAVFCGIAGEEDGRFQQFYKWILDILGYRRKKQEGYPEIAYSNLFIGMTLRFECLHRLGRYEQLLEEMKEYYLHMADTTNTLWEHDSPVASLNHGLSSVAGALIIKALTGLVDIDEAEGIITVDESVPDTAEYQISIGLNQGKLIVTGRDRKRTVTVYGPYNVRYRQIKKMSGSK